MGSYNNFSQKSRTKTEGAYDNVDNALSYDPINIEKINYEQWTEFLSYYRYYVDKFAVDILGMDNLYPFQRLLLRAMGRYPNIMMICCRGLTKSYICAIFMICMAILYPGIAIGIVSGNGNQARMVVKQKIEGELIKNENVRREIQFPIKTGNDECLVTFKNGSSIRAINLGQNQKGDGIRGWRFQLILVDEARLVKSDVLKTVIIPMTTTPRQNAIMNNKKFPHSEYEEAKMIYISSAYLKTCDLYQNFLHFYNMMTSGDKNYFVACLDYKVGIDAGMWTLDKIMRERDDPEMTNDKFTYEYCATFVGSANDSYYPYELTSQCRVLDRCELEQPKKSQYSYVITHDVAVSGRNGSDNACTHVIKLVPRAKGTFSKDVIFTKTMNGASLKEQRDFLRELLHIRFPNTEKLVIDAQSAGQGLLSLLEEPWSCRNAKGDMEEFPPLILDDDEETARLLPSALPIIRGISATAEFNAIFYPYMKSCFEDKSLRLLVDSSETDEIYKDGKYSPEEQSKHVEHDYLIQELSNIKQAFTNNGRLIYDRIVQKNKRDRATSLMYGLSVVFEFEKQGKANLNKLDVDILKYLSGYIY
jgi:hypothetical protein